MFSLPIGAVGVVRGTFTTGKHDGIKEESLVIFDCVSEGTKYESLFIYSKVSGSPNLFISQWERVSKSIIMMERLDSKPESGWKFGFGLGKRESERKEELWSWLLR